MTLAFLAMAIAAWRVAARVHELSKRASVGIDDLRRAAGQAQHVIAKLQGVVQGLQSSATEFQGVATRAVNVSHRLIDQVERPVRSASALAHGLKVGAAALLGRGVPHDSTHRYNGGERHG